MNTEAAKLRVEQLKTWLERNREYLEAALITNKAEMVISMKGTSIKLKLTQYPDEV